MGHLTRQALGCCCVVCVAGVLYGCREERDGVGVAPLRVDGGRALALAAELVELGCRDSGTPGAARAALWISAKAREFGYDARVDEWQEPTPSGEKTFRNVVASRPGAGGRARVLLGSHFDTKALPDVSDFEGANDSGSSTGLLLEIMRVWASRSPPGGVSLEFAFFDGEECQVAYGPDDGLHGSRRLAGQIRERGDAQAYAAMVLLDMVGDRDLRITLSADTPPELARALFAVAEAGGVRDQFGYFAHGSILDDHRPFQQLGIPSIDIIDFEYGPGNAYWHTAEDTVDKLSAQSLETVGNVTLALVGHIARDAAHGNR